MTQFSRNKMILAKIESTYGTDPTPVEGSNAITTKNLTRTVYGGNTVNRDLDLPKMGNDETINTGPIVQLSFDCELAGNASAGVAPHYGELLRACGLAETVVAVTSVTYAHVSTGFESVTIYYNYDGEQQVIVGARGNVTFNMSKEGIPMMSFTFTGQYARPTAVSMYDPTYTDVTPQPFNDTNTTTFSVHSQAVVGTQFSYDAGQEVVYRNLPGNTSVEIVDRAPAGQVTFEALPIATKDFFAATESHAGSITLGAISIVHGSGAGNIATLSIPTCQLTNISEPDDDKIRHMQIPYKAIPTDAGDDEFSLAFT